MRMNARKKMVLALLLPLAIALQGFAQERVSRPKLSFADSSGTLAKATGWAYNSTFGEWIDYENVISNSKDYKDKYKSLLGEWMMSRVHQNFLRMQTKLVIFNEKPYYVLVVEKWSGRYEYPAIQQDWYTFRQTWGYIFTESEFLKLRAIESLVEVKTSQAVQLGSKYEEYSEEKFLALIQTKLMEEAGAYSLEYTFPVMKSREGAIRFYVPDYFASYSRFDFEKQYFETDLGSFKSILID